jgi:hypothetical protein
LVYWILPHLNVTCNITVKWCYLWRHILNNFMNEGSSELCQLSKKFNSKSCVPFQVCLPLLRVSLVLVSRFTLVWSPCWYWWWKQLRCIKIRRLPVVWYSYEVSQTSIIFSVILIYLNIRQVVDGHTHTRTYASQIGFVWNSENVFYRSISCGLHFNLLVRQSFIQTGNGQLIQYTEALQTLFRIYLPNCEWNYFTLFPVLHDSLRDAWLCVQIGSLFPIYRSYWKYFALC